MEPSDGNPYGFHFARRNLPHMGEFGACYMVTWRLHAGQAPLTGAERQLVCDALRHFDKERYWLGAYVVMDDHVHAIVQPRGDRELSSILHAWKSFTANRLQRLHRRTGCVWQDESYDRVIRSPDDLVEKASYILTNPVRRWLDTDEYAYAGIGSLDA